MLAFLVPHQNEQRTRLDISYSLRPRDRQRLSRNLLKRTNNISINVIAGQTMCERLESHPGIVMLVSRLALVNPLVSRIDSFTVRSTLHLFNNLFWLKYFLIVTISCTVEKKIKFKNDCLENASKMSILKQEMKNRFLSSLLFFLAYKSSGKTQRHLDTFYKQKNWFLFTRRQSHGCS